MREYVVHVASDPRTLRQCRSSLVLFDGGLLAGQRDLEILQLFLPRPPVDRGQRQRQHSERRPDRARSRPGGDVQRSAHAEDPDPDDDPFERPGPVVADRGAGRPERYDDHRARRQRVAQQGAGEREHEQAIAGDSERFAVPEPEQRNVADDNDYAEGHDHWVRQPVLVAVLGRNDDREDRQRGGNGPQQQARYGGVPYPARERPVHALIMDHTCSTANGMCRLSERREIIAFWAAMVRPTVSARVVRLSVPCGQSATDANAVPTRSAIVSTQRQSVAAVPFWYRPSAVRVSRMLAPRARPRPISTTQSMARNASSPVDAPPKAEESDTTPMTSRTTGITKRDFWVTREPVTCPPITRTSTSRPTKIPITADIRVPFEEVSLLTTLLGSGLRDISPEFTSGWNLASTHGLSPIPPGRAGWGGAFQARETRSR